MLIGELSKITGFSKDTIRYYEKLGLLKGCKKILRNRYSDYSEETIALLSNIKMGKEYGLTLSEIKDLLRKHNHKNFCNFLMEAAIKKLHQINNELERLNELKIKIESGIKTLSKCQN